MVVKLNVVFLNFTLLFGRHPRTTLKDSGGFHRIEIEERSYDVLSEIKCLFERIETIATHYMYAMQQFRDISAEK